MELGCTQCGARLDVRSDARLLRCSFCGTALAVDGSTTLFHEVMEVTVPAAEVAGHLRRFFAGSATAAGLEKEARLEPPVLEYFPFWSFQIEDAGSDRVVLQPGAPSALVGLQGLTMPPGSARSFSPEVTGQTAVIEPEVPPATARDWLLARNPGVVIRKTVLTHLPLYRVAYTWRGKGFSAAVDGVSGRVFPSDFPTRVETPFRAVAAVALAVFGLEGLAISHPVLKLVAFAVTALPMLGVAWLISRKA